MAETRPRLRSTVQSVRHRVRGRTWHVLADPSNNQHFRVSDAGYRFVGLLDGRRTVEAAWSAAAEQLGDDAPTQGEALRLLGQLHTSNLLDSELAPDARRQFERQRKRVRKEVGGYLKNILFLRVPIWDPDRFLDRWTPAVGWVFGPVGVGLWLMLMFAALWALAGRGGDLWNQSANVLAPGNLPWLYACFVGIKALHELGHAFSCKRFGRRRHGQGEVHTVGIMLMVLTPVPYVDATSAWALPSKWQRAFVGAAGMFVELAVAAVAAIVWTRTAQGTLTHGLSYNLMFIAGVSTILFNANPLIKFDGYYILSDVIEVPNLYQRSTQYLKHLVKRFVYGVKPLVSPAHSLGERVWFFVYGWAALGYRIFLGVVIVTFVADKLFFVGAIMAIMALVGYLVVPTVKLVHYLAAAEPARVRGRAVLATVAMAGLPLAGLAYIPAPDRPRASGVVLAAERDVLFAEVEGFVEALVTTGSEVAAGDVVVRADHPGLRARLMELEARQRALRVRYQGSVTGEPAERRMLVEQLAATAELVEKARRDLSALTVVAPRSGVWTSTLDDDARGHYVRRGDELGVVLVSDGSGRIPGAVKVAADQYDGPRLAEAVGERGEVEIRPMGRPDAGFRGRVVRSLPTGQRRLPSAALGQAAGGPIATDPQDAEGRTAAEPFFAFEIEPSPGSGPWHGREPEIRGLGGRVVVRFELERRPLLEQWVRSARQALQQRFGVPADAEASGLGGLGI
ncbi:MAG: hypothetical protein AAFX76_11035 [Planctomycetota bacterium]